MKDAIWNILTLATLAAIGILVLIFAIIFLNPNIAINPFKPADVPPVALPGMFTSTPRRLPPTWTPTPGGVIIVQTPTRKPSATALPSATGFVIDTFTPTATATATPTNTPLPTNTPTPYFDRASILSTSPNSSTTFNPGQEFDATALLQNVGERTWTTAFYYRYRSGVKGSLAASYNLRADVAVGNTTTIIIDMVAPSSSGSYDTTWELVNEKGVVFETITFSFKVK
jgi:hypothetical protein